MEHAQIKREAELREQFHAGDETVAKAPARLTIVTFDQPAHTTGQSKARVGGKLGLHRLAPLERHRSDDSTQPGLGARLLLDEFHFGQMTAGRHVYFDEHHCFDVHAGRQPIIVFGKMRPIERREGRHPRIGKAPRVVDMKVRVDDRNSGTAAPRSVIAGPVAAAAGKLCNGAAARRVCSTTAPGRLPLKVGACEQGPRPCSHRCGDRYL